ncbi:MAG: energy-coupled thiamine transporter ThiT [Eubacteriales bacterium]|nr:energy-coupled thiamine transporter ThiT [Eubacteriales bacterium]
MNSRTRALTVCAVMIALSTALALVCAVIPFLNLPFGGGFTVASMLPIIIVSYMYGLKWGFATSFAYSLVQLALGALTGDGYVISLFTVGSDNYLGVKAGIFIILIDYIIAYTLIGFGGIFRFAEKKLTKTGAIVLGTVAALSLRYIAHIISGTIFFGVYAEWFFSQEGFYAIGAKILEHFSGLGLSIIYSVFYNGLYMLPEIIITSVCAVFVSRIPLVKKTDI